MVWGRSETELITHLYNQKKICVLLRWWEHFVPRAPSNMVLSNIFWPELSQHQFTLTWILSCTISDKQCILLHFQLWLCTKSIHSSKCLLVTFYTSMWTLEATVLRSAFSMCITTCLAVWADDVRFLDISGCLSNQFVSFSAVLELFVNTFPPVLFFQWLVFLQLTWFLSCSPISMWKQIQPDSCLTHLALPSSWQVKLKNCIRPCPLAWPWQKKIALFHQIAQKYNHPNYLPDAYQFITSQFTSDISANFANKPWTNEVLAFLAWLKGTQFFHLPVTPLFCFGKTSQKISRSSLSQER